MNIGFNNIKLSGVAVSLPKTVLDLTTLGEVYGHTDTQRIMASTGIRSVRVAQGLNTSDLCMSASLSLLEQLNTKPHEIDAVIFVSQTPDAVMPATSVMLQHKLGISNHSVAFDISYGCSGYIYGLYQA